MPELPDVTIYLEALRPRVVGQPLEGVRLASPFILRSVEPPMADLLGRRVDDLRRLGKRIVLCFEVGMGRRSSPRNERDLARDRAPGSNSSEICADDFYIVIHLMIAGRLRWERRGAKPPGKIGLAAFDFPTGTLLLTEASPKKRAALYVLRGASALAAHDPGGLEVFDAGVDDFRAALRRENHTLKRALTDPHLFSGIGNAYSDEILHAARLSPVQLTSKLADAEIERLYRATQATLQRWIDTLRAQFGDRFPGAGEVTAFRPDFAVHGRFGKPCPVCGGPVQRIRYAENETNYCPACQTGGRLLADRSLSRLLKEDWPKTLEELEMVKQTRRG